MKSISVVRYTAEVAVCRTLSLKSTKHVLRSSGIQNRAYHSLFLGARLPPRGSVSSAGLRSIQTSSRSYSDTISDIPRICSTLFHRLSE